MNGHKYYKNKTWLEHQYNELKKSTIEIGKKCNVSYSTINYWLNIFNIPIRTLKEASKLSRYKRIGKLNGNWKGYYAGKSGMHKYMERHYKKSNECENCKKEKKLELSFNHLLGKHTRNSEDWKWLCHSCHIKKDWELGFCNNQYTIKENVKNGIKTM